MVCHMDDDPIDATYTNFELGYEEWPDETDPEYYDYLEEDDNYYEDDSDPEYGYWDSEYEDEEIDNDY